MKEEDLKYIDDYLKGKLTKGQINSLNTKRKEDAEFSDTYQFVLAVQAASQKLEAERIKNLLKNQADEEDKEVTESEAREIDFYSDHGKPEDDQSNIRVFNVWPMLRYTSIAASLVLILLVWQPFKSSNNTIFSNYTSGAFNIPTVGTPSPGILGTDDNLRGAEFSFKGYTQMETDEILTAIELIRSREFSKAENKLAAILKPKEGNPDLLLYLAIAQLNSKKVVVAVSNFEKITNIPNYQKETEVKFHLAMGYIKIGEVKKARKLLRDIIQDDNKFSEEAKVILNELRWF